MPQERSALKVLTLIFILGLNVALIVFYVLWKIADSEAINAAELRGFDESLLLPNSELTWIAGQASLGLLLALDVCLAWLWLRSSILRTKDTP